MYPCSIKGAYEIFSVGSHASNSSAQDRMVMCEQSQDGAVETVGAWLAVCCMTLIMLESDAVDSLTVRSKGIEP
eukprot:1033081-Pleurochrysis_carterae.AAC.1